MNDSARIASLFAYNSCLAIFLTYGVFFNKVAAEFGEHALSTSSVFATFALTYSLSSLLMGALMVRLGAKKTIFFGGALMALGLGVSSLAPSIPFLILSMGSSLAAVQARCGFPHHMRSSAHSRHPESGA